MEFNHQLVSRTGWNETWTLSNGAYGLEHGIPTIGKSCFSAANSCGLPVCYYVTLTDGFRVRERGLAERITDVSGHFLILGL